MSVTVIAVRLTNTEVYCSRPDDGGLDERGSSIFVELGFLFTGIRLSVA